MSFIIQTPILVFINIVFLFFIFLIVAPAFSQQRLTASRRNFAIILTLLFCLFSFWGKDWFNYLQYFGDMKQGYMISSMESIYNHIGMYCSNYIMFRFVIWGAALYFFYKTINLLPINRDVALFFFCAFFLIWFSYARASLAMSIMFYGSAKLVTSRNLFSIKGLYGIVLICVSFFFHKSSIIAISAIAISELLMSLNRKVAVIISILIFTIGIIILKNNFGEFIDFLINDEDNFLNEYASRGNVYLNADNVALGPGVLLQAVLERTPYYILAYMSVKSLLSSRLSIPASIQRFMMIFVVIILFSTIFAFDLELNTNLLYGRMMRFLLIPSCVILTYYYTNNYYPKLTRCTYTLFFISTIYSLVYVLYNSYMAN